MNILFKRVLLNKVVLFIAIVFTFIAGGCSSNIEDYQNTTPELNLGEYFNGDIIAWGLVQDYSDKVTRRFCVEITGTWQQEKGLLAERFYFNDGEVSTRNWQLTRTNKGEYIGTAEDVVGTAVGKTSGYAFHWQYHLKLTIDNSEYQFFLDDWMYQIDNYRLFNRTEMKKFGITVAELTLFFDKEQPLRQCQKVQ